MFFLKPRLPVSETERAWVDQSMLRLSDLFGGEILNGPVVLPSPQFFPHDYEPTEEWAAFVFERVCRLMGVDPNRLQVHFIDTMDPQAELAKLLPYSEHSGHDAAGTYSERESAPEKSDSPERVSEASLVIRLKWDLVQDPVALIATIAHELAHVLLLGDRKIERDMEHMEPLTDLYTVFCGFGVFNANSAFTFRQWSDGHSFGWSTKRLGYLSEPMYGYALARYAQMRGESRPAWSNQLSVNVRAYMKASSKVIGQEAIIARKSKWG